MKMPPAFCITCEAGGRRERAAAQFAAHGLGVTFVEGIYAPTWGLRTVLEASPGYTMPPGQVGCLLSHYMLWQALLLRGDEEALVFEDDVRLEEDFVARLAVVYAELPAGWQLLYVGTDGTERERRRYLTKHLVTIPTPFGTHAYLARRSALPVLLDTNRQARTHIDLQIAQNTLPRLSYYVSWPSLAGQFSTEGAWPSLTASPSGQRPNRPPSCRIL
jgi:GR25 family glycosyltransferase involved in LPS biosynthesis